MVLNGWGICSYRSVMNASGQSGVSESTVVLSM